MIYGNEHFCVHIGSYVLKICTFDERSLELVSSESTYGLNISNAIADGRKH